MRASAAGIADGMLSLIYPPACAACGVDTVADGAALVCPDCVGRLVRLDGTGCPRCASPVAEDTPCAFCLRLGSGLDLIRSAFWFMGPVPGLMHRLKYRGRHGLARAAAELMLSATVCAEALQGCDLIAPVPLHWWRRLRRGYNQSEMLAREIAALAGAPFEPGLAFRLRRTRSQTRLDPDERKRNVERAFKVRNHTLVKGRSVCIVDDVMTTGATAGACAAALKDAGAARVTALTFARA